MNERRLIDANALDVVGTIIPRDADTKSYVMGMEYILNKIDKMPTIEERKTGKWIDANDGKWNTIEVLKCSVCGEIDNRMYRTDNFCPNCGAKMEHNEDDQNV